MQRSRVTSLFIMLVLSLTAWLAFAWSPQEAINECLIITTEKRPVWALFMCWLGGGTLIISGLVSAVFNVGKLAPKAIHLSTLLAIILLILCIAATITGLKDHLLSILIMLATILMFAGLILRYTRLGQISAKFISTLTQLPIVLLIFGGVTSYIEINGTHGLLLSTGLLLMIVGILMMLARTVNTPKRPLIISLVFVMIGTALYITPKVIAMTGSGFFYVEQKVETVKCS